VPKPLSPDVPKLPFGGEAASPAFPGSGSVEADAEEATRVGRVRKSGSDHERIYVEVGPETVTWKRVGVHGHDILVTYGGGVVGAELVRGWGGEVRVLALIEDCSTSAIVDRIKSA